MQRTRSRKLAAMSASAAPTTGHTYVYAASHEISSVALFKLSRERSVRARVLHESVCSRAHVQPVRSTLETVRGETGPSGVQRNKIVK